MKKEDSSQSMRMRRKNHIGTLVVCLPVPHTGGALIVSDDGNREIFPFEELVKEKNNIPWVAFYTDVKHQVEAVESGHRVTLQYNLHIGKEDKEEVSRIEAPVA